MMQTRTLMGASALVLALATIGPVAGDATPVSPVAGPTCARMTIAESVIVLPHQQGEEATERAYFVKKSAGLVDEPTDKLPHYLINGRSNG